MLLESVNRIEHTNKNTAFGRCKHFSTEDCDEKKQSKRNVLNEEKAQL
jgi:hypothetical protein